MTTESTLKQPEPQTTALGFVPGEGMVLWILWATYGSFYFCRQNISAAIPEMRADLGFNDVQIGLIVGALKVAYGVGQLVNGQLAERFRARYLLAVGMLGSAALNLLFGLGTGFFFFAFVWACNGYCQALGWPPCMRVAANWFASHRRGRLIGVLGTSYQATAALTYVVAGFSVDWLGWRGAFYIPTTFLIVSAVHTLFFLRETPGIICEGEDIKPAPAAAAPWRETLLATLNNPALWFLGIALAFLDACRYGFTDWGLTHLYDVQEGTKVSKAALQYAVLPAGGIAGALVAGWATDRFFNGRRAPVIAGLLILLGLLALAYDWMTTRSVTGTIVLLVLIGFCIFGPQVLLVGTAPSDMARKGTAAAAAGFVNFMGYMGAFAGDTVTGYLKQQHNWQTAIRFWAVCAFVAALAAACLWRAKAR